MTSIPFETLACPLDHSPLMLAEGAWRCAHGHSFDIARQGYVHLLPVQKKRSLDPGDSKAMVAARRRFLEAGHYAGIAGAISERAMAALGSLTVSGSTVPAVLDAGCGEGYYLRHLAAAAGERPLALAGVDISKWAVLSAARRDRGCRWVVGSNANLPVLPGSLDLILCLFGFPAYGEFARVLKPGGRVLQVDAGPDHLRELREIIYPELKPPRERQATAPEGFEQLDASSLRFTIALAGQGPIADLLAMTPHFYRGSADGLARAANLTSLVVTVDVVIREFVRQ